MRSICSRVFHILLTVLCTVALCLPYATFAFSDLIESEDAWIVFTDPVTSMGGISLKNNGIGDSDYTYTVANKRPVIEIARYAYFSITDQALLNSREVTVRITLLDNGTLPTRLQYCSTENAYETIPVRGNNSGDFITVEIPLINADLGKNAQNLGASFRLEGGTIYAVSLRIGIAAEVNMTFTDPVTASGGIRMVPSNSEKGDSEYHFDTVQGQAAMVIDQYAYFHVTNPKLTATSDVMLTITFLDDSSTPIYLQYRAEKSAYSMVPIHRYNTGEYVTAQVPMFNTLLGENGQNYGASFRLQFGTVTSLSLAPYVEEAEPTPPTYAPQTEANNIIGKGMAGYQVWFRATEGDVPGGWHHWGQDGSMPTAGNVHPEIYPYTDDYLENGATLYENGLGDLGNGKPSLLFDSTDRAVIRTHMQWMKEYDIDGAAVQRFYSACCPMRASRKNTLQVIQEEAEAQERIFYVMYDFSYAARNDPEAFIRTVKLDFIYNAEETGIVSSPYYGHADGKPVVCLWGLVGDPATEYFYGETATTLIEWFQSRGYYVIGGCPDNNYDKAEGEYIEPFTKLDMLTLWTVGRYNKNNMQAWYNLHIPIDLAFCEKYDIDYQPVIWSGFGWTNMGNNGRPNFPPRDAGEFLWDQAYILKNEYGIDTVYFAMWDEYDEGTAIMKAATDYFEIPTDQYFLTYATDGWWLSNDFYLRVADAALDMMQGEIPLQDTNPIAHSEGPIYWRNSFESRETTFTMDGGETFTPTVEKLDVGLNNPKWHIFQNTTGVKTEITSTTANSGESSFRFSGTALQGHWAVYKIADTVINASQPLELSYSIYASNANGRQVYADLLFADGSRLSHMNTAVIRSVEREDRWERVSITLGPAAEGKTIIGVLVGYAGEDGYFEAYLDDFLLEHSADPHQWDNGTVQSVPSTDTRGTILYACENEGCHVTVTEWFECEHLHTETHPQVDATCTATGLTAGVWCTACKRYVEGREVIPVHETEFHPTIPAGIGAPGREAGTWCTVCERYIEGGAEIPALPNYILGDVDRNGTVDSTDARLVLQYAVGKIEQNALALDASDVDGNRTVDSTDARLILQKAVGKIHAFSTAK